MDPSLKAAALAATVLTLLLAGCAEPEPLPDDRGTPGTTGGTGTTGPDGGNLTGNATGNNTTGTNTTTATMREEPTSFQGTVGVSDGVATNDPANFTKEVPVNAGAASVGVRIEATGNGSAEFRLVDPSGQVMWSQTTTAAGETQVLESVNGGALVARTGPWSIQATATQGFVTFNGTVTVRYAA